MNDSKLLVSSHGVQKKAGQLSMLKEKCQLGILHPAKITFWHEGETRNSRKKESKQNLSSTENSLKGMIKEVSLKEKEIIKGILEYQKLGKIMKRIKTWVNIIHFPLPLEFCKLNMMAETKILSL